MISKFKSLTNSKISWVIVALIAIPFVFWGMGDVFTRGNTNNVAKINNNTISVTDFINHVNESGLNENLIRENLDKNIFEELVSQLISQELMKMEIENLNLNFSDQTLKNKIINNKNFHDEKNNFSRTKYEKFLLKNGYSASTYERFLKSVELKGQLLNYYSGGIKVPEFIVNDLYQKEKQTKEIEYLNLSKIYSKKTINEKEIQKFYDDKKKLFEEKFISFKYLELKPEYLTEKKDFDQEYYEKLDQLENDVLDGKKFEEIIYKNEKNIKKIKMVNSRKIDENGKTIDEINTNLFQKIFSINEPNTVQFINFDKKYYIVEITDEKNIILTLKDKDLKRTIESQLKIGFKIKQNKEFIDKINNKKFDKKEMLKLSQENSVPLNKIKINGINDSKVFKPNLVKKIFDHSTDQIFLVSDNIVQDNYIIRIEKELKPEINKKSEEYRKYYERANAKYISKVYKSYDRYINENYKIDINQKVLEKLKNSF